MAHSATLTSTQLDTMCHLNTTGFKQLIKKAARIHEESWINGINENDGHYEISTIFAAEIACNTINMPNLTQPVYLLLQNSWNDILEWAAID